MSRKINLLLQDHVTFLQRALEIDVRDLVAEVGLLLEKSDQAIFDLQENNSSLVDCLTEGA